MARAVKVAVDVEPRANVRVHAEIGARLQVVLLVAVLGAVWVWG
jgi:hypothetical protein